MKTLTDREATLLDVAEAIAGLLDEVLVDAAIDIDERDEQKANIQKNRRTFLRNRAAEQVNAVGKLARSVTRPDRPSHRVAGTK